MKASEILEALIARDGDKIWATEVPFYHGKTRIDFWTLEPIPSQGYRASSYEIKVSRDDFKRDTAKKQQGALDYSDRFWYVTPPSLLRPEEMQDWAGLLEWDGRRFKVRKKAPPRIKKDPDWGFIVSLIRASGDCQRDYAMLRAENSFLRNAYDRNDRIRRQRSQMHMDRWIGKSQRNGPAE